MTTSPTKHGYMVGDYVMIGNGERGVINGYIGDELYRVQTPRGEVTMHMLFIDGIS